MKGEGVLITFHTVIFFFFLSPEYFLGSRDRKKIKKILTF